MPKLILRPSGQVIEISEDQNVLDCLRAEEIYIRSSCGGGASCGDCMIKVVSGEDHLSPPPFEEIQLLGNVFHLTKERLACQLKISGDVSIDISHHNLKADQDKREKKNKDFSKSKIKVKKKDQVQEEKIERDKEREEWKKSKDEEWQGHWKQEDDPMKPKRLGGAKRPKLFKSVEPEDLITVEKVDKYKVTMPEKKEVKEDKKETEEE